MKQFFTTFLLIFSLPILAEYELGDDWKDNGERDGIKSYTQVTKKGGLLAFKAEGYINAQITNIMAILRDVEQSNAWTPDLIHKSTVRDISDIEAITYTVNDVPWPFSDREVIMSNKLFVSPERDMMIVKMNSVEEDVKSYKKGLVRAFVYYGEVGLRPISPKRTYIEIAILIDPRGYIPTWIVNWVQQNLPYNFIKAVEKRATSINQPLLPGMKRLYQEYLTQLPEQKRFQIIGRKYSSTK